MLIKKELVDSFDGFCTDIFIGQDLIFEIELISLAKSLYMYNNRFYHYYMNPNSTTISPKLKERNVKNLLLLNQKISNVLKKYDLLTNERKEYLALTCFYKIYTQLLSGIRYIKNSSIIEMLIESEELKNIIDTINYDNLSKFAKGFVYLIKNKRRKTLYYYCLICSFLKK